MSEQLSYAFALGLVAALNPCGFALLPAYLAYYLGLEDPEEERTRNPAIRSLAVAGVLTTGFVLVFGVFGIVFTAATSWLGEWLPYFTVTMGGVLVVLGIAMIRGFEPVVALPRMQVSSGTKALSSVFVYGVSYALASLSCTIGLFTAAVTLGTGRTDTLTGILTFVAYGVGMGALVGMLTIAVGFARVGIVNKLRGAMPYIGRISGILLVPTGLFVMYYGYFEIQQLRNPGTPNALIDTVTEVQTDLTRWITDVGEARIGIALAIIIAAAIGIGSVLRDRGQPDPDGSEEDQGASRDSSQESPVHS